MLDSFSSARLRIAQDLQQAVNAEFHRTLLQYSIDLSHHFKTIVAKLAICLNAILAKIGLHVVLATQLSKELLDLLVLEISEERALLSFQRGELIKD